MYQHFVPEFVAGIMPKLEEWFTKRMKSEFRDQVDFGVEENGFRGLQTQGLVVLVLSGCSKLDGVL